MKKDIIQIKEGFGYANGWLLATSDGYLLIDPAVGPEKVKNKNEVSLLVATHAHYDHIGSADIWRENFPALKLMMHKEDQTMLADSRKNASLFFGRPKKFRDPDLFLDDLQEIDLGQALYLRVYHTPGHTKGSCCFLYYRQTEESKESYLALITGDTVFATDIGRMDLPGGSEEEMRSSIRRLQALKSTLPPDLPVLPGHGPAVQLADLKDNYWFMNI